MIISGKSDVVSKLNTFRFEWKGIMRSRIFWVIIAILIPSISRPAQSVLADDACDKSENITFPGDYYQFAVDKSGPENPVIKQQLEDLYNHGALSGAPESYGVGFSAKLVLKPGTLTWNQWVQEGPDDWVYDHGCNYFLEENGECTGHWEKHYDCKQFSQDIYRSIRELRVFLIPDKNTVSWLEQVNQSPKLKLAYPDFWEPVVVNSSVPIANWWDDQQGLHFLISDSYSSIFLPTYLYVKTALAEIPNSLDGQNIYNIQSVYVIAVCDAIDGSIVNYGGLFNHDFNYDCAKSNFVQNKELQIQSIELSISKFFFDIPGNFAIGVAAIIDPAKYPDPNHEETIAGPETLHPTNIGDGTYMNTSFTVWMIVTTPCTMGMGDAGCETYFSPQ